MVSVNCAEKMCEMRVLLVQVCVEEQTNTY